MATFLDGSEAKWRGKVSEIDARQMLARWIVSDANPYFSRHIVNQTWRRLMSVELVCQLDGTSEASSHQHFQLLDDLAKLFVESGHDLRTLERGLMNSRPYQASAVAIAEPSQNRNDDHFATWRVRHLNGDQLYDSLLVAGGYSPDSIVRSREVDAVGRRQRFSTSFPSNASGTTERTLLQALEMMNGELVSEVVHPERGPMIANLAKTTGVTVVEKVELLFLSALGRMPNAGERMTCTGYVGDDERKLADVFWALLNTSEFGTNH
ncbi:MAG: DUF1553 domain-containing protein [Planctomycetota bacterium]